MTEDPDHELYLDTLQEIIDLQSAEDLTGALGVISANLVKYSEKPEILLLTAVCSYRQNAVGQAIELCEKAYRLDPDCQEVVDSLAVLKTITGNVTDGLFFAKLATTLSPHPDIPDLLPREFSSFFQALNAAAPSRHYLDGLYLFNARRFADAITAFESELNINPDNLNVYKKLGHAQLFVGDIQGALDSLSRNGNVYPEDPEIIALSAMAMCMLGDFQTAAELCKAAVDKMPDSIENIMQVLEVARYFDGDLVGHYEDFILIANDLAAEAAKSATVDEPKAARKPDEPINIAFVSNDLRAGDQHAFLLPIIEHINPKAFDLTVYQQSPTGGPVFQEFKSKTSNWRRVVDIDDSVLAMIISRQNTDILVDLCGFSSNGRSVLFAASTAPVVTNLLCEPFGFGAPGSNVIISDAATVEMDRRNLRPGQHIVETEGGLFAIKEPNLMGDVQPLPALENGFITYGAKCSPQHFSPGSIAMWSEILKHTDGARLLLGNVTNIPHHTREHVMALFANSGVGERIDFLEGSVAEGSDKAFFNRIDIYLDSLPVNGTMALCHALWMGVPVVTATGTRRSGVIGASILTSAGQPQWIGTTPEGAIDIAVALARDIDALAETREQLRDELKKSTLMDTVGYTSKLQAALRTALDLVNADN